MTGEVTEIEMSALIVALTLLAEDRIPTDILGLLNAGDPMRGIPPDTLLNAILAAHLYLSHHE